MIMYMGSFTIMIVNMSQSTMLVPVLLHRLQYKSAGYIAVQCSTVQLQ